MITQLYNYKYNIFSVEKKERENLRYYNDARLRAAERVSPCSQRFTAMRVDRRRAESARVVIVLFPAEGDDFDLFIGVEILLFSFDGRFRPVAAFPVL